MPEIVINLEQFISTAVSLSIIFGALFYVYIIVPFLRRNTVCVYDADKHRVYWLKPVYDKKNMIYRIGKFPVEKDQLTHKYWILKNGKLNMINLANYNSTLFYSVDDVKQLMQHKLTAELYRGGLIDFIPYLVIGAIIGMLLGVIIGFYVHPTPAPVK
jgi:hypothetical protein